jgi:hypothetical protein
MTSPPTASHRLRFLIVGAPRSGTTLVQRLLAESSGVCVPPETHFFSMLVQSLSAPNSPEQTSARLDTYLAAPQLSVMDALDGVPRHRLIELLTARRWADAFVLAVEAFADPHADIVGEKTPNHLRWCQYLLDEIPHLRIVGVMRDPRAVVNSRRDVPWGVSDPLAQAMHWRIDAALLAGLRRDYPDRVMVVRYEELVNAPELLRARLGAFLATAGRPLQAPRRLFGADEVWKRRATGPVDPTRALVWRDELPAQIAEVVAAICWPQMLRWGYEPGMSRVERLRVATTQLHRRPRSCARVLTVTRLRRTKARRQVRQSHGG